MEERERVRAALAPLSAVRVYRSSANFLLLRVPDSEALRAALAGRGILVRKLSGDPLLAGCLRVNVGTREENDRLIRELSMLVAGQLSGKRAPSV
jgi:histidinol-phosphate aminotransferase